MANNFTGRQLIIDTVPAVIPLANFKVGNAVWVDVAAAGDTFTIVDAAGRVYTYVAYQANYPYVIGKMGWISGPATVTVLTSGKVYMYLD